VLFNDEKVTKSNQPPFLQARPSTPDLCDAMGMFYGLKLLTHFHRYRVFLQIKSGETIYFKLPFSFFYLFAKNFTQRRELQRFR
jgi:hypothetical protein